MTKLEEMWEALAAYQPQADVAGYGLAWARMCSERTCSAAALAADAAAAAADAADAAAADAATALAAANAAVAAAALAAADAAADAADAADAAANAAANADVAAQVQAVGHMVDVLTKYFARKAIKRIKAITTALPAAQRTWVDLTDEELNDLPEAKGSWNMSYAPRMVNLARAIEQRLKEKNT